MKKVIVTGGGGFVGKALCLALKQKGYDVYVLARSKYPELEKAGINTRQCDISNAEQLVELSQELAGAEAIFHTAAYVQMWGRYKNFYKTNIVGTQNLIDFAKENKIGKFIYTSSPSVIADGKDLCGVNESYPYPKHFKAYYPETKAAAEQAVIAANSPELKTLSLRPHLIWGPGDTNLIPTVVKKAQNKKLARIGDGNNLVDLCFIDDCVSAHLCALDALENNPKSDGKAYFISQGEPTKLWEWIDHVLVASGEEPVKKQVPFKLAYSLATIMEAVCKLLPHKPEPMLTKFLVSEMATSHYFDISRAKELLGFEPKYSIAEAMQKTFPN